MKPRYRYVEKHDDAPQIGRAVVGSWVACGPLPVGWPWLIVVKSTFEPAVRPHIGWERMDGFARLDHA